MNKNQRKRTNLIPKTHVTAGIICCHFLAFCILFMISMMPSMTSYAKKPTIDSEFQDLNIGKNLLKVENFDGSQIVAGCFIVPETGEYSFNAVNVGELNQYVYLLDNDFAKINEYGKYLQPTKKHSFGTFNLEKDKKYIFMLIGAVVRENWLLNY